MPRQRLQLTTATEVGGKRIKSGIFHICLAVMRLYQDTQDTETEETVHHHHQFKREEKAFSNFILFDAHLRSWSQD